jgi:nucleotide-binding universal stress UspA family protein
MPRILFPTDFSDAANNAFIYALRVADRLNADLLALHVYHIPVIKKASLPHTLLEFYEQIEEEEFKDFQDNLPILHEIAEADNRSHVALRSVLVKSEDAVRAIVATAEKEDADMIIMGTKGATGLKEIFIGSVAGEVMENANIPVLAVPEDAEFDGKIDNIAVTTEFKSEEIAAIRRVVDFAARFEAKVSCVNVDLAHTEAFLNRAEAFEQTLEIEYPQFEIQILEGTNIRTAISQFMKAANMDMLAMVTHRRNFFQELFRFSRAKEMAYHLNTPILSIQSHTLKS